MNVSLGHLQHAVPDSENIFDELKRYVRFDADDESALRSVSTYVLPHTAAIANEFYERLENHENARAVFSGPEQIERLRRTLVVWMRECFEGPWDAAYYERRARIGHVHVRINLSQRYMFGAMDVMRGAFTSLIQGAPIDVSTKIGGLRAINKLLDLELAIMLETYREAFVERVRSAEREQQESLERLLAIAHARYDSIVEQGEALVVTFDASGRIVLFNAACERLTGLSRLSVVNRSFLEIFFPDGGQDEVRALWRGALAAERAQNTQLAHNVVLGGTARFLRWQFSRLPSDDAPLLCALGMDVTEAHNMSDRAVRAERLAALGTMATGLAHEIRNPLNAAHLQLTLMQRRLAKTTAEGLDSVHDAARLVAGELERLATLVADFLQFARPRPPTRAPMDLVPAVRDLVELLAPEAIAQGVTLVAHSPPSLVIDVDEEYIKQVFHNLLRNAVEACGTNGDVQVSLSRDATAALISVSDSGAGFTSTNSERIFEPFFTTKAKGTGLGLAIVHRIVTEHGGTIDALRHDNRTVFCVRLPFDRYRSHTQET